MARLAVLCRFDCWCFTKQSFVLIGHIANVTLEGAYLRYLRHVYFVDNHAIVIVATTSRPHAEV